MVDSRVALYQDGYSDGLPKGIEFERLISIFRDAGTSRLLDIGGGEGALLLALKKELPAIAVNLVDISEEAIATATAGGLEAVCIDVGNEPLPFPDNHFDGIHCGDVIEHVFDTQTFIDEVLRVAAPGSPVVITTPNLAFWFNRIVLLFGVQPFHTHLTSRQGGHIRLFPYRALRRFLESSGARVKEAWGYGINTEIGYGLRFRRTARVANFLTNWCPALASHVTIVIEKPPASG